jgi:murein L,D-transpeptidase YafK
MKFIYTASFFLLLCIISQAQDVDEYNTLDGNDKNPIENVKPHRRAFYFEGFKEVNGVIDSIVIYKSKREMQTYHRGKKMKLYIISLGMEPKGKKQFEGDLKTPEGLYRINERDAISSYHKNLGISYPNYQDSVFAAQQGKSAGGEIKIHGFPNRHQMQAEKELMNTDWTLGCIAVTDHEVDELYTWVRNNCPILILP